MDANPSDSEERPHVALLLGGTLRRWRERNCLPLRSIAEHLGVTCATVSCWESGKRFPSGQHIDAIAGMMNVRPHLLFVGEQGQGVEGRRPASPGRVQGRKPT